MKGTRTVAMFAVGVMLLGLPTSGSAQHWGVIQSILDGSTAPAREVVGPTNTVLLQRQATPAWFAAATEDHLYIGDSLRVARRTSVSVALAGGNRKGSLIFLTEIPTASSLVEEIVRTHLGRAPVLAEEARYEIREDADVAGALEIVIRAGAVVVNLFKKHTRRFAVMFWRNQKMTFDGTRAFFMVDDSLGIIFLESGEISLGEGVIIQSGGLWVVRRGQVQAPTPLDATDDELSVLSQVTRNLTPSPGGLPIPTPLAIGGVALLATILAMLLFGGDDTGISVPLPNF